MKQVEEGVGHMLFLSCTPPAPLPQFKKMRCGAKHSLHLTNMNTRVTLMGFTYVRNVKTLNRYDIVAGGQVKGLCATQSPGCHS